MKITTCTCGKDVEQRKNGLWYHVASGNPACTVPVESDRKAE